MMYRVSNFFLFILTGFMAIMISMPSAHAVLTHATGVTESSTPSATVNTVCKADVTLTSDGKKADGSSGDPVAAADSAYCPTQPLPSNYTIEYTFNTSIHEKMDSITIWSNGGSGYADDELRSFSLEIDYKLFDGTSATLVMSSISITATGGPANPKSVNFNDGSNDVVLLNVSKIRLSDLIGKSVNGSPIFRELQLNVEPVDNDLVTTITMETGTDFPKVGDTIAYHIMVTNNGSDHANGVSLLSKLPPGFTPTIYNGINDTGTYVASTGSWSGLIVDSDDSVYLLLEGTINSDQKGKTLTTMTIAADNPANDTTDTTGDILSHSVTVQDPKLTISASAVPTANAATGDTITYTYTVKNTGNVPLTQVEVEIDNTAHNGSGPVPVAAIFGSVTDLGDTGDSSDTGTDAKYDTLGVLDEVTFKGTYLVTQTDFDTLR